MSSTQRFTKKTIRTKWVQQWCSEFLAKLDSFQDKDSLEKYCKQSKEDLIEQCQAKSKERAKQSKKPLDENSWRNSVANYVSQIRKAIETWQSWKIEHKELELTESNSYPQQTKTGVIQQHLSLLYMNLPSDFHKQRLQPTQQKKQEQRRNLQSINCVDEYQNAIEKLIESRDYLELTVGLIAATGRRPSEILKTAEFTQKGQFEVYFSGQLKAKEQTGTYPTFTLVESAKVVDGHLRLQRMPEIKQLRKKTLAKIDSGRNSTINSKVVEHFSPLINPPYGEEILSAKNLRASYAAIAIYLFCPYKQSTNQFITERLGHTSDSTATSYEDYQITDSEGKPLTRGVWLERVNEQMSESKQMITNARLRITKHSKEVFDDQEFLTYADLASRVEELIRLAKIGKQFENGELVKEVIKVEERIVEVAVETSSTEKKKPDFSQLSDEQLFGSNAPYTATEKLRRAVAAIKLLNEGKDKSQMWAINISTLKSLTNTRTQAIQAYLDSDEGRLQVKDYNQFHELGYHHNRGRGKITEVLTLI